MKKKNGSSSSSSSCSSSGRRSSATTPKPQPQPPRIRRAGIDDDDDASNLSIIGGIVEKGVGNQPSSTVNFFAPLPPPQPTVLPFPIARHRSHGPHWGPADIRKGGCIHNDDDNDEIQEKDFKEFDSVASFANPVKKKEKKHLDFTGWREINPSDTSLGSYRMEEHIFPLAGSDAQKRDEGTTDFMMEEDLSSTSGRGSPGLSADVDMHDSGEQQSSALHVPSLWSSVSRSEQVPLTLEGEIDAENRARLHEMSPDEIAEAQAEIMEKISPALQDALKRRAHKNLNKQKSERTNLATDSSMGDLQSENQFIGIREDVACLESDASRGLNTTTTPEGARGIPDNGVENVGSAKSHLWNAWSERVEAVRELRFSFDGTAIKDDFVHVPEAGNLNSQNGYSADNVTERDFLRTEGDPGAAGYTIKEAVALTRSVIPGQRTLALHLLAAVIEKALYNIHQNQVDWANGNANKVDKSVDWEAVWAFALGPEPELALSLRLSLDENHNSVVLACAKVIHCIVSCDIDENYFDISEKITTLDKDICIAPIFRSRPEIDFGFLHGGYWKYSAKPSNILPLDDYIMDDNTEGKHTIQDDIVVSGQDFVAGLVRMGVLSRFCYLLEADPTAALEECIISILIAIARHSPVCANAIIKCQRLVEIVVSRFNMKGKIEIYPSMIKSVVLLKVLARYDRKICTEIIRNGVFRDMTWHLSQRVVSLDQWLRKGMENCKLTSALMVEQLRFWKVCIQFGYCVSHFKDYFPALYLWLHPPNIEKLGECNLLCEFSAISSVVYIVLGALARTLPNFYSQSNIWVVGDDMETWSWNHVGPIIDLAVKWIAVKSDDLHMYKLFKQKKEIEDGSSSLGLFMCPLLWVISSVMHMLSCVLERVIPEDAVNAPGCDGLLPWPPEFVPRVGLEIIKNGYLSFSDVNDTRHRINSPQGDSFIAELCNLRHSRAHETSLASVCCLRGLLQVTVSIDKLIQLVKPEIHSPSCSCQCHSSSQEGNILEDGILNSSKDQLKSVLASFMNLISLEWNHVQSVEVFGRGGPAPGVGFGWGASGGGFWSTTVLLAQTDAGLLMQLLEIVPVLPSNQQPDIEETAAYMEKINSVLGASLTLGPRDAVIMEKTFTFLFQVPVLKCLDHCSRKSLHHIRGIKPFGWEYAEDDYMSFSKILASHYRNRWLCVKKKKKIDPEQPKGCKSLETIHEDQDMSDFSSKKHLLSSLIVEWSHQRLPLPSHWFLSPISTIHMTHGLYDFQEVAKSGLFFLFGLEGLSPFGLSDGHSSVQKVPLIWKLHSLTVILLTGLGVLREEKCRDVYGALQHLYGQLLVELRNDKKAKLAMEKNGNLLGIGKKVDVEFLRFQSEIHESYSTFMENVVEEFCALSYGDLVFGRQLAIYLHRGVESAVRLSTWNALSNACVLHLLPTVENCLADAEGYLEPIEGDEMILEAYMKSWVSGALDKAAGRGSLSFHMALHHLSSFIFHCDTDNMSLLGKKLVKSLLRDYSRKPQHEGMVLDLILHGIPSASGKPELEECSGREVVVEKRLELLTQGCEGNSSLLKEVEKLRHGFRETAKCREFTRLHAQEEGRVD